MLLIRVFCYHQTMDRLWILEDISIKLLKVGCQLCKRSIMDRVASYRVVCLICSSSNHSKTITCPTFRTSRSRCSIPQDLHLLPGDRRYSKTTLLSGRLRTPTSNSTWCKTQDSSECSIVTLNNSNPSPNLKPSPPCPTTSSSSLCSFCRIRTNRRASHNPLKISSWYNSFLCKTSQWISSRIKAPKPWTNLLSSLREMRCHSPT